jgi:hypothetical protein
MNRRFANVVLLVVCASTACHGMEKGGRIASLQKLLGEGIALKMGGRPPQVVKKVEFLHHTDEGQPQKIVVSRQKLGAELKGKPIMRGKRRPTRRRRRRVTPAPVEEVTVTVTTIMPSDQANELVRSLSDSSGSESASESQQERLSANELMKKHYDKWKEFLSQGKWAEVIADFKAEWDEKYAGKGPIKRTYGEISGVPARVFLRQGTAMKNDFVDWYYDNYGS